MENNLGDILRHARKSRKMTLVDAASEIGISKSYVSEIERGEKSPRGIVLAAIESFIGQTQEPIASSWGEDIEAAVLEKMLLDRWRKKGKEGMAAELARLIKEETAISTVS